MLAAAAAATVFAAGVSLSVAAAVVSFSVAAAVVSFAVMVVAAAEIFTHLQGVVDKGFRHFAHVAFGAAHNQDKCLFESVDGTAADTAADEGIHLFFCQ